MRLINVLLGVFLAGAAMAGEDAGQQAAQSAEDASKPRLVVQTGHSGWVQSVAFSPDGKTVVSGSWDGTLKLWDGVSGRELHTLAGHTSVVHSVAFSPDGKTVASGSFDHTVRLWDVKSGVELRSFTGHTDRVSNIVFSPDGRTIVSGSFDHRVKLWDVASGRLLRTTFKEHLNVFDQNSLAFSHDGKSVVIASNGGGPSLWNVTNGHERLLHIGHYSYNSQIFSPNGNVVAAIIAGGGIKFFDVSSGQELLTLSGRSPVVFSPDGKTVASAGDDNTIKIWEFSSGRALHTLTGHTDRILSISFSPDGKTVVSGSEDHTFKLWDVVSGQERNLFVGNSDRVNTLAFSPDGKSLLSGNKDKALNLWYLDNARGLRTFVGHSGFVYSVAISSDGKTVLSGGADKTIKLWDISNGQELNTFTGHSDFVYSTAISSDGRTVVSGGKDKSLKLWDTASGRELRTLTGHTGAVYWVAFSPDSKTVMSGSEDKTIKLWDVASGQELRTFVGHSAEVLTGAFSNDGKAVVSGSADHTLKLWDVASGQELRTLSGHVSGINSVAFTTDGKTIISAGGDKVIKFWDAVSGRELRSLAGHLGSAYSVSISPDGKIVATGGADKLIKLWRTSDGKLLASLYSFNDGSWVVTDPEGRFDTSDLEEIKGLHWVMPDDPLTPVPLEAFMKEYYEPRLLARILNGEQFKPVPKLMDKNRVQPEVKIIKVEADPQKADRANVTVEVVGNQKDYLRDGKAVPISTAANDLHLFRDGQLVGYLDGKIVNHGAHPIRKTFSVRLPSYKADQDITFSAYAFNDDRVKSNTVRSTRHVPSTLQAHKGHAYVISMGVNQHDNSAWNLRFAANDARLVQKSVTDKLTQTGRYQEVVQISLISDGDEHRAAKSALRGILAKLSGKEPDKEDAATLKDIPNIGKLQTATPDDLILLTFSGHGFADDSGNFYLINQDTGTDKNRAITDTLKAHSISSAELSNWLRDVDAGDMTMIVDACQSAASVQGNDFKPGPMGSRGLGQLSFDKGMRILAASQADEYALENDQLKQGLLSFSLVTDGLDAFNADREPKDSRIMLDEWLRYGVDRVPSLAEEVKTGKVHIANRGTDDRGAVRVNVSGTGKSRPAQQPALFDFAKKRRQVEVAGSVGN